MAAPSSLRVSSIEVDPTANLAQKAQEANLVSLFLAQQLVRDSDRQHDETYKQSQLMQDAVSGDLSLGDVMSDADFAAEMKKLEAEMGASGKVLKDAVATVGLQKNIGATVGLQKNIGAIVGLQKNIGAIVGEDNLMTQYVNKIDSCFAEDKIYKFYHVLRYYAK